MKRTIIISIFLHIVVFLYLINTGGMHLTIFEIPPHIKNIKLNIKSSIGLSPNNEIWNQIKHFAKMPPQQRLNKLDYLMQQSLNISAKSLTEISSYLGIDNNSYTPNISNKPFESHNATIYTITQITYPNNKSGYKVTLIDKNGTSLDVIYPPKDVTPELIACYKVMSLLNINPTLKQITIRFLGQNQKHYEQSTKDNPIHKK